jgi:hypothetical protein
VLEVIAMLKYQIPAVFFLTLGFLCHDVEVHLVHFIFKPLNCCICILKSSTQFNCSTKYLTYQIQNFLLFPLDPSAIHGKNRTVYFPFMFFTAVHVIIITRRECR